MAALLASRNVVAGLGPAPAAIGSTGLRPVRLASFAVCRVSVCLIGMFAGFLTRSATCPWSIADRFALPDCQLCGLAARDPGHECCKPGLRLTFRLIIHLS